MGETQYACYSENMAKMNEYITGLDTDVWTQNLYWGWLHQLRPLLDERGNGYPIFMQNTAWMRKDLNTFLGSWTELKHDTILYTKQVYAEMAQDHLPKKRMTEDMSNQILMFMPSCLASENDKRGLDIRGLLTPEMKR